MPCRQDLPVSHFLMRWRAPGGKIPWIYASICSRRTKTSMDGRALASEAGWGRPLAPGHYQGIAAFGCFSSYMAEVVEISMENDQPRIHRVVGAIDCGQVVNPNILEQQIQGGVSYSLGNV